MYKKRQTSYEVPGHTYSVSIVIQRPQITPPLVSNLQGYNTHKIRFGKVILPSKYHLKRKNINPSILLDEDLLSVIHVLKKEINYFLG